MKKVIFAALVLLAACSKQEVKPVVNNNITIPAGTYVIQGDSLIQVKKDIKTVINQ